MDRSMSMAGSPGDDIDRWTRLERTTHDTAVGWWLTAVAVVAVLIGVEAGVRGLPLERRVFRGGDRPPINQPTVKAFLRAEASPADVMFLGSSRVHRGIVLSMVTEGLAERGLGDLEARSYAFGGAHVQEIAHYAEAVCEAEPPRLLLIGLAPRALRASQATGWDDMTTVGEWWRRWRSGEAGDPWDRRTPGGALHHELASRSMAVAFRERFREAAVEAVAHAGRGRWGEARSSLALPARESPMTGGAPWAHRNDEAYLGIFDQDGLDEKTARAMRRQYPDGRYEYHAERSDAAIARIGRAAQRHGVEVVIFELPWPELLERHWPPGVQADFRRALTAACDAAGLAWVPFETLGVEISDAHFSEHSHLNLLGARRLTAGLVDRVIEPRLAAQAASAERDAAIGREARRGSPTEPGGASP